MDLTPLPVTHQATIPEEYLDVMGHMNVMWYTHLFDQGTFAFFAMFGMDAHYYTNSRSGGFALEQHTRYLAEVRLGDHVTVRTRALGRTAKRLHFMHFLTKGDGHTLAATTELVGTHVDLRARRTSPFPDPIARSFDEFLAEHSRLPWEAPVCGVMSP